MPLPGHKMIPADWQERHRPTITATFRSTVRITRLADQQGTRDWQTNTTAFAVPYVVYEGPARIQRRSGSRPVAVAGRTVTLGDYLVAIPTDAQPVLVEDLAEILDVPDDPAPDGLTLKVVDVGHADVAWQRNLGCDLHQPTPRARAGKDG